MNDTLQHEINLLPKIGPCDGESCPAQAYFTLLDGSTRQIYCDICLAEVLLDLMLSNAELSISQVDENKQIYRVWGSE